MYAEDKENRGIIYKYTSPSGKSYIGQTIHPGKRKHQHYKNALDGHKGTFYDAIRKYGWDSFKYEVLFTTFEEDFNLRQQILNEREIYYIGLYDTFRNGYNETIGGNQLSGQDHPSYGTHLTIDHARKLKQSVQKQVSQYDNNGNYIATYQSVTEAGRITGCDPSQIIAVCRGKQYSSKGYQWRYGCSAESIGSPKVKERKSQLGRYGKLNGKSKSIYQYTFQGELVNVWESALCAEREQGFSSVRLSKAIRQKKPYGKRGHQKYFWSFNPLTIREVKQEIEKYNDQKISKRKAPKSSDED